MSAFVEFLASDYQRAGNVFAGFTPVGDFNLENALAMMWFAQLTYEVDDSGGNKNAAKIAMAKDQWQFRSIMPFRERAASRGKFFNTTGLVGERHDAIVIAFAGTDPGVWETVVTDAGFLPGPENTHTGFQAAFRAAAPLDAQGKMSGPIGDAIARSSATGRPIFLTGHSLGAALAILTADAMATQGVSPHAMHGFGRPCPGGATFRARCNAALGDVTYRLVHGRDVVARVPRLLDYAHVGRLLQIDRNTKFPDRIPSALSQDPRFFAPEYLAEIAKYLLGGGFVRFFKACWEARPRHLKSLPRRSLPTFHPPKASRSPNGSSCFRLSSASTCRINISPRSRRGLQQFAATYRLAA
jgi:triacylglycerol lipase